MATTRFRSPQLRVAVTVSTLAMLVAVPACSGPGPTSMLIDVESTLEVPTDLDGLEIAVVGLESGGMFDHTFGLTGFPDTYSALPHPGHESETVVITVSGTQGGARRIRRVVQAAFVPGTEVVVRIDLTRDCLGVSCGETEDCAAGHCVAERPDGGMDAGPRDARTDAPMDSGCGGGCDDHVPCTMDRCAAGACVHTPDDTLCAAGQVCQPTGCGAACTTAASCDDHMFCNGTETCVARHCMTGTAPSCDDMISCTHDSCDGTTGMCTHVPDDAPCGDGNACNGVEMCDMAMGCRVGAPLDCNDGSDCSVDGCGMIGSSGSGCLHLTRDSDADGHGDMSCPALGGIAADDCDDADGTIHPGAPEVCNGRDDNCDTMVDEGFTCASGTTGSCMTTCGSTGSHTCGAACGWSVCAAPAEICDGVDDDCNGVADDGFGCVQGATTPCATSCGTTGTQLCDATCHLAACVPPLELCGDGIDQDCDGVDPLCRLCPMGTDAECADGLVCNGIETCYRGNCVAGTPIVCMDPQRCTVDVCVESAGGCIYTPNDGLCQDGNFCNGSEVCSAANGCLAGMPPTCGDADACTDDTCVGSAPGACTHTTRDTDGDGHGDLACPVAGGIPDDDCNDAVMTTYPGAPEVCNGVDDNCDSTCDNGFACCQGSTGSCATSCGTMGTRVCSGVCSWGLCSPPAEICNGIDDDCNSACDDGFGCCAGSTGTCATVCGSTGSRLCSAACGWGSCTPPVEVCNGVDDNCDGVADEGFACVVGSTHPCAASCGSTGTQRCSGTCALEACIPPVETCNGLDDDCDGVIDNGFTCPAGGNSTCAAACGTTGSRVCSASCTWGSCTPPAETCNGIDDDCNTFVDDGFTCASGANGGCTSSCGTSGSRVCSGTCSWGTCTAPAETCNGVDDDCVGGCDNGFACCQGSSGSCTSSCGTTGSRACGATCTWGTCTPPAEICNGIDDDCDTRIDQTFACAQGAAGSCSTSCGTTGSRVCSASCAWGSCTPPAEVCNGIDDNCDTFVDNGFACVQGSSGTCTSSCGTTGSRLCSAACAWGTCTAPAEMCNGIDDDCVSGCDNGFACCRGSSGSCVTGCGTTGTRLCGAACTWGTCAPPAETCNGIDDDCNAIIDDGFACVQGSTGACTASCGSTGTRMCSGTCSWGACAPPAEICNGIDDDCNTVVDNGFTCAAGSTRACATSCATTGTQTCSAACAWGVCVPPTESCNGIDDNCNGQIDETSTCVPGATGSCTASCGSTGSRTCTALCNWGTCNPPVEVCNGVDDDCDALVDDGFTCPAGGTGTCTDSCGTTGSRTCSAACAWGTCNPPAEVCNGVDDDCVSGIDNGFACVQSSSGSCTSSCGTTGSRMCSASCAWGACNPPAETCNGIDDDCNTVVDNGFACAQSSSGSCTSSCGTTGARTCSAACTWGACIPPAELCNGVDDNCDTFVDNGFACAQGSSGSCTASCGSTGSRVCSAACAWGACTPPVEVCNGVDDDCVSGCDNGFSCCRGSTGSCVASCGTTGSRVCSAACGWGACTPPVEICNGIDDDCNAVIDNGFTCAQGSSSSCVASCGTTGSRVCSAACAWGSCTPPAEICNGIDDNCDTFVDNGFACAQGSTGSCVASCGTTGSRVCSAACAWGSCTPPAEICNGVDDNCDTIVDNGFVCAVGATGSCVTSCGSTGSRTCNGSCAWGACIPPVEICNNADDDCDTFIDEGFTCRQGSSASCTDSCGTTGTHVCNATCSGYGACTPPAEICNGIDDDCVSGIDNGFACALGATGGCTASCGTAGTRACNGSCMWGACSPPAEICNGIDDDCDTVVDNGFACAVGATGSCTDACGTTGTRVCSASCTWGACTPPAETCNGIDDDCVSGCDNGFACCQSSIGGCTTGCGSTGSRSCGGTCTWGSCNPPAETCNGLDDDCVSGCDNGFTCCAGTSGSCTTGCGSTGSRVCSAACAWGGCTPPVETCNGLDDDCTLGCDNGFTCCQGASTSCTASCGTTGTQVCNATCTGYGACTPPAEVCGDTIDNDCDTLVDCADSDCSATCGGSCPGATVISNPGGRYTAALVPNVYTGTCGGAGAEAYFVFNILTTSDVFLATHQTAGINTVLYVRSAAGGCAGGAQVGCNTDADGQVTSRLTLTNLAAGTYNVFVDTVAGVSSGTITLDAYITAPGLASDRCGNPTFLPAGTTTLAGSNGTSGGGACTYSDDAQGPSTVVPGCSYIANGTDRVFYFYLPTSRLVTFSSCAGTTNYDTEAYIRTNCVDQAAASSVVCDDDGCGGTTATCSGPTWRSTFSATIGPGLFYFFADGFTPAAPNPTCCGNYTYAITGL